MQPTPQTLALAVIVLNLNGCDVLVDCLASLRKSRFTDFVTIVVDNGSTDDSVQVLQRDFPEVVIIANPTNLGFTGGNNIGMERALDLGACALLLLNNDTVLDPDCLGTMVHSLESDPAIGAVTPRILFHSHPDHIWCAGGNYSLWRGIVRHHGLRKFRDDERYARPQNVNFATGCALLVRSTVVQSIGLLDDDLFAYNEDVDYSLRISEAGFNIRYEPGGVLWHREGWSSRRTCGQVFRMHLYTRNILRVHRKHRRWYHLLTFLPFFAWRNVSLSGGYALVRGDWDTARGIVDGIAAYFRGETGPVK